MSDSGDRRAKSPLRDDACGVGFGSDGGTTRPVGSFASNLVGGFAASPVGRVGASAVELCIDQASSPDVAAHLARCDACFVPPLHERVDIEAYAVKICGHARRFEAWVGSALIGLLAAYLNRADGVSFITNLSVEPAYCRGGLATALIERALAEAHAQGLRWVRLEVSERQLGALRLYERCGFGRDQVVGGIVRMSRRLEEERVDA